MIRKRKAFTILELLIAVSISGFIVTGMIQAVRSAQNTLMRSRMLLRANKTACLLFNQIERDFNTAFIPEAEIKEPPKKDKDKDKDKNKQEEPPSPRSSRVPKRRIEGRRPGKKKKEVIFFKGEADEDESRKIGDKKYRPFTKVSFVNTNPLQVWGQRKIRLARVGYELVFDKEKSIKDHISYNLYRKETPDLSNETFKEPEDPEPRSSRVPVGRIEGQSQIRKHLVATDIKEMYIEYQIPKPKEETPLQSFTWGKTTKTKNIVPQQINIRITFWGDKIRDKDRLTSTYSCVIPVFSYPTKKKKVIEKKKDDKKKDDKKGEKGKEKDNDNDKGKKRKR